MTAPSWESERAEMATKTILVVDDDVEALRLVGLMLERQGYQILAAANGYQAIQKAIETQPSLIVLDLMMPDIDGYEVATRLRGHPATDSIPILMFTAKSGVNDRIAGFQAGADDFLTKPVKPKELASRIEALLASSASASEGYEAGHVVGFLPTKGGLGTTMLALNSAVELRRMYSDFSVALVELQQGGGAMSLQLALEENDGLSALMAQPLSYITQETLHDHMVAHDSGLKLLFSSSQPRGMGMPLDRQRVRTILRYLSDEFDYVLLDLPPDLGEPYRETLSTCETILMAVEPNRVGMAMTQRTLDALDRLGIDSQKERVVLIHRAPALGTMSRSMVEQTLHRAMVAGIPPARDVAQQSIQNGRTIVEMQPHSLVTQQIRRVVQSIVAD